MPFLLAEILNFQGSTHLIGVGSLSCIIQMRVWGYEWFLRKKISFHVYFRHIHKGGYVHHASL